MHTMTDKRQRSIAALLACCLAAQEARVPWWQLARTLKRLGSVHALVSDPWEPLDAWELGVARALAENLVPAQIVEYVALVEGWEHHASMRFIDITEPDYPASLSLVFNAPPFITVRGDLLQGDALGVAVVGTRNPTREGSGRARRMAQKLAEAGITVISGLALGIDAAAHEAALAAGGRTLAVLGHGLALPVYPRSNRHLADAVALSGALVSQFLPTTPPTVKTFPMRNVVTSGIAQGTVVIEASHTSGARMQARLAVEHGKRVWLLDSLVERFDWARKFAARPGVRVVTSVEEVMEDLQDPAEITSAAGRGLPTVPDTERRPTVVERELTLFDSGTAEISVRVEGSHSTRDPHSSRD
jgi:DNA processing protein